MAENTLPLSTPLPRHCAALLLSLVLLLPFASPAAPEADDPVLEVMQAEIQRALKDLRLPDSPPPYFIACALTRTRSVEGAAVLGAITATNDAVGASLLITLRVGDYALDNSNFLPKQMYGGGSRLDWSFETPVDGDPAVIRRALWWVMDFAYKNAIENYRRKRAVLENRSTPPVADDTARAPAYHFRSVEPPQALPSPAEAGRLASELSRGFLEHRTLRESNVRVQASVRERWYANSEGTRVYHVENNAAMTAQATAQADDGVMVGDMVRRVATHFSALPPVAEQKAEVTDLGRRVEALRTAPLLEDFAGPVLMEGQAATELCARILPDALASRRLPIAEDDQTGQWLSAERKESLRRKLGRRVMATGFNVTDDPTLDVFEGTPLVGRLPVDLEGVKPETVDLVKGGILRGLLTTRTPDKKLPVSNGHTMSYDFTLGIGLADAGISSLLVRFDGGLDDAALRARLVQAITDQEVEFGLVIRRLPPPGLPLGPRPSDGEGNPDDPILREPLYAFRVNPDGSESLVRVVALKGLGFPAFKDVLAAGSRSHVYNHVGKGGLRTVVAPSILFEEAFVVKPDRDVMKPPLLPSPLAE